MPADRSILHVDMDAFYAAIEQLDNPALRGKPVLVGGSGLRGVVATASYEARVFGCHSAQPMSVARRLCPHAIVVRVNFSRYRDVSRRMFDILESFSPQVQPLSIDEAFLDVTGSLRLHGSAVDIAKKIRSRIHDELQITASIGVAPNKFLAKLASDLEKPDGLVIITPETIDTILPPLPVTKIWGIGPKTAKRLEDRRIRTIGDLRTASPETLTHLFGEDAERVARLARGIEDRPVVTDSEAKQVSHERTFHIDVVDPDAVRAELHDQAQDVAARLRKHQLQTAGVTLKIRFGNFETITRSRALESPTDRTDILCNTAREVFNEWANRTFKPVRLIGFAAKNLNRTGEQLRLFTDPTNEKHERLDRTVDAITKRFGTTAVRRGMK